jgi:ADP-ribosyl-[dinitrogen reductase] hydrolase
MLVEIAIGDAYGAGFEYADENLPKNDLTGYTKHPTHQLNPGQYTDDTQMSIAIAEAMIAHANEGVPWTAEVLADFFVRSFKRDWRDGYARGFQKLLEQAHTGAELIALIVPISDKSGGAMRATPLGLLAKTEKIMEMTAIQAAITHNTADGIVAAQVAALMTHYLAHGYIVADLREFLCDLLPTHADVLRQPWVGRILAPGLHSVRAAMQAILDADVTAPAGGRGRMVRSLSQILKRVIAFTGDVDTAGAIAMGAASNSPDIINDLPDVLRYGLERGPYGHDFLVRLEEKLYAAVGYTLGGTERVIVDGKPLTLPFTRVPTPGK